MAENPPDVNPALFAELKKRFPEVPDDVVLSVMTQNAYIREKCINALGEESNKYLYNSEGVDSLSPGIGNIYVTPRQRSNSQGSHTSHGSQAGTPGSPAAGYSQHPATGQHLFHSQSETWLSPHPAENASSIHHSQSDVTLPDFERLGATSSNPGVNFYSSAATSIQGTGSTPPRSQPVVHFGNHSTHVYSQYDHYGRPYPPQGPIHRHPGYSPRLVASYEPRVSFPSPQVPSTSHSGLPTAMVRSPRHSRPNAFPEGLSHQSTGVQGGAGSPSHMYTTAGAAGSPVATHSFSPGHPPPYTYSPQHNHIASAYIPVGGSQTSGYSTPPQPPYGTPPTHQHYPQQAWAPEQVRTVRSSSQPAVVPLLTPTHHHQPITTRSESLPVDETAYTQALISHQRSRLHKLMQDYEESVQALGKLRQEVGHLDKTLLERKKRQSTRPFLMQELAQKKEKNRQLLVDVELLSRQADLENSQQGAAGRVSGQFPHHNPTGQPDPGRSRGGSSGSTPSSPASGQHSGMAGPHLPPRPPLPVTHPPAPPHSVYPYNYTPTSTAGSPHYPVAPGVRRPQSPPPLYDTLPRSGDEEQPQWECHACTYLNYYALTKCEVCEMPRMEESGYVVVTPDGDEPPTDSRSRSESTGAGVYR